ncbi:MAG: acyl-CoA dehydrogenase family protein, partial [Chromatiales bacterium]|nr:acyl-CoA dehydrogenase family protein [Chromatiales bacterium]
MERLIFDEEHEMFRESVRRFMQKEIGPHGERWREQGIVDREAFEKAGEQGLLMLWAEEKYGGAGIEDFRYEQIIIEENVKHGEVGFFINLHTRLVGPYIGTLGTEEQKQRFLPDCIAGKSILAVAMTEAGAGSDISGTRTRAEDKGDYWLLNGSKTYISNGLLADVIVVAAKTVPDKPHALGLFLVERGMEGFSRGTNMAKIGLKAQDTSELFFENVKIPKQ